MDTFQGNPSVRIALLGLTAAGIGITLTAASRCVHRHVFDALMEVETTGNVQLGGILVVVGAWRGMPRTAKRMVKRLPS